MTGTGKVGEEGAHAGGWRAVHAMRCGRRMVKQALSTADMIVSRDRLLPQQRDGRIDYDRYDADGGIAEVNVKVIVIVTVDMAEAGRYRYVLWQTASHRFQRS